MTPAAPPSGPPPAAELPALSKQPNPPAELSGTDDFAPPPGPPPSHQPAAPTKPQNDDYMAPPPGPPPSKAAQHDWEAAVPDTSLFPPPPAIFSGFYQSPATNATEAEAEAGEAWCNQYPLFAPLTLDPAALFALGAHNPRLMSPAPPINYRGDVRWLAPGVWTGSTTPDSGDGCIIGYPPLYSVLEHSPLAPAHAPIKTIYFEVVAKNFIGEGAIALGFTALPYPAFRMPGWHRGSLAVHGDDGHKYINDRWGGKAFTQPFRPGETYGMGMTFRRGSNGGLEVEVFFTRQGRLDGKWNLHEETDAVEDLPVTGLEGFHDLSCAVGTYKGTEFEVVFDPVRWLFRPEV